ncbi:MAG: type II toxin-antitoxin system HicA family toxin [Verrucomicrobia bacterium]|nr:type II toxin-antitoxin system HicA family toxin [Verrucomicrobiota bacterium]
MKRRELLRHLHEYGCEFYREGGEHTVWWNPRTRRKEAVPRHAEIGRNLSRKICRNLSVPEPRGA